MLTVTTCLMTGRAAMKYKAFIFDIDGTLTDLKTWEIVPSAAEAINQLQEKGYPVIIASGRAPHSAPKLAEAGIHPDYYVGSNGHIITDHEGKTIWGEFFDRDLYHRINDFCRKNNLGLFWKMEDCCYIVVDHPNMPKIMEGLPEEVVRTEVDDDELPNSGALVGEEKDRQLFMSEFAGQLECVNGGLLLFDVNKLGVSKKNGLEVLLKMLNIDPEDVMAFGDSENDIEMLQMAGTAVVMGDGMERAKAAADYIAEPTYADGIMKTLKKFGVL